MRAVVFVGVFMSQPPHFDAAQLPLAPPAADPSLRQHAARIAQSYQQLLGQALVRSDDPDTWRALWLGTPTRSLPTALRRTRCFSTATAWRCRCSKWISPAFTRLPSRFSAEAPVREERARLLARVSRDGYIDDYSGVRIASSGRRFRIEQATVWNLVDADRSIHGQAATFAHWTEL
jgi:hypothetical protein